MQRRKFITLVGGAALTAAETAKAAAAAPATLEELEMLDARRVTQHVAATLKREGLHDIVGIKDSDFRAAIAKVPAGWVDGRSDVEHLADIRTAPDLGDIFPDVQDEPTEGGGLAALLGK